MKPEQCKLETIASAGMGRLFKDNIGQIIENISDVHNFSPLASRSMTFKITFTPEDKENINVSVGCNVKLAKVVPAMGKVFLKDKKLYDEDPQQMKLA